MRPCSKCGAAIANDLTTCPDCKQSPQSSKEADTDTEAAPAHSSSADDDRSEMRRFLWWSFAVLVVCTSILGYLVGGPVGATMLGILGFIVFLMLEQLTH